MRVQVACCGFYNGTGLDSLLQVNYRQNEFYQVEARYEFNRLDKPSGDVDIHLASLQGVLNVTPDMQFAVQDQFDNISENVGFLGHFLWEFRPGSELLIAFGQSAIIPGTTFRAQTSQLSIRLGHVFRL